MSPITLLEEAQAAITKLSDEDAGALVKALICGDDDPALSDMAGIIYPFIKGQVDRLEDMRAKRSASGRNGGSKKQNESKSEANGKQNESKSEPHNQNHNQNQERKAPTEPKEKRERFTPPTVAEVEAYAREKGYRLEAARFVDFYASKGWKVGSSPMKDWKAAVRNWAARDRAELPPNKEPPKTGGYEAALKGVDYTKLLYKPEAVP